MSACGADAGARLCGGEAALDSCAFAGKAGMAHFAGSLTFPSPSPYETLLTYCRSRGLEARGLL
eukprot:566527-Prymnesium_polylepis.1